MNGAFYIGAIGLQAQQAAVDITANNIANLNTLAFKRASVRFTELVSAPLSDDSHQITPSEIGPTSFGVAADGSARVFSQGELRQTDSQLDLAIQGDGFIELLGPGGQTMLWRGGTFKVSEDGYLAAANGMQLKAMISVPREATRLLIDQSGKVMVTMPGQQGQQEIGQLDLTVVSDTNLLKSQGDGLYRMPEDRIDVTRSRPGEENAGMVMQGYSEASNVRISDEMVSLLMMQRAYAANARVVQAGDELMGIANGLKR